MEERALLEALLELAEETALPVQRLGRQPIFEGLSPSSSGVCRVRGELRVLLSDSDPVSARVAVLARALRRHRGEALESRFLAPALRECLDAAAEQSCANET
jgi:hypothetical protein